MFFDFKRLDIYRKVPKDLTQPTKTGALISICSVSFITFLFVSELYHFLNDIGLDIQDEMGRHEVGYLDSMVKVPTDDKKGCWFQGKFVINKVPGNFHIGTHSAKEQPREPDMRHIIHGIEMGDKTKLCQWVQEYLAFSHHGAAMPAIWFKYELTPMTVRYTETRAPLYTFLTTVCAIVGGTFTVAGIIDALIFSTTELFKKFEMGKLS